MSRKTKKVIEKYDINNTLGREGLIYARVSSPRQKTEGHGLESQEGRCRIELRRLNVPYVKTFPDSYSGGGDFMERPAMKELLNYIDKNPHKKFLVIFDDLKRFARDTEFHFKLRTAFKSRNVSLRCLNYNFDDTPEGRFVETIMAGQAELERHQNRRQVIQKMKARLEAGYWTFGSKKGYDIIKDPIHGKIAVINDEGRMLKEGLEKFANRDLIRKVDLCRFLVEKGFWKKQKPERYIDKITHILQDCFYCGDIEYPEWEVTRRKGQHEGIIDPKTLRFIQELIKPKNEIKRIRKDISEDFPLRGLLVCENCHSHLTGAWSKGRKNKYPYYFCQNSSCSYKGKSVNAEIVLKNFFKILKNSSLNNKIDKVIINIFDRVWNDEINSFKKNEENNEKEKIVLEEKIRSLTDMVIKTDNQKLKEIYEKQIEKIVNKMENINSEFLGLYKDDIPYRTALDKSLGLLKSPYFAWQKLNIKEQQELFFFIFEEKLSHNPKTGYRTDNIPYSKRLFEEFATANTHDVDTKQNLTNQFIPLLEFVKRWGSV